MASSGSNLARLGCCMQDNHATNMKEVWIYTIFRKGKYPHHEQMRVKFSYHGPIFWERQVVYIYLCTCHFEQHCQTYKSLCQKLGPQVCFSFDMNIHIRTFTQKHVHKHRKTNNHTHSLIGTRGYKNTHAHQHTFIHTKTYTHFMSLSTVRQCCSIFGLK